MQIDLEGLKKDLGTSEGPRVSIDIDAMAAELEDRKRSYPAEAGVAWQRGSYGVAQGALGVSARGTEAAEALVTLQAERYPLPWYARIGPWMYLAEESALAQRRAQEWFGTKPPVDQGQPKTVSEALDYLAQGLYEARHSSEMAPTRTGPLGFAVNALAETAPGMGASWAANMVAPVIGPFLVMGSMEGDEAYRNTLARGGSKSEALLEGAVVFIANGIIEQAQIGGIEDIGEAGAALAKGQVTKWGPELLKILAMIKRGGGEEVLQGIVSKSARGLHGEKLPSAREYARDALYDFLGGALAEVGYGGAQTAANVMTQSGKEAQNAAQVREDEGRVQEGGDVGPIREAESGEDLQQPAQTGPEARDTQETLSPPPSLRPEPGVPVEQRVAPPAVLPPTEMAGQEAIEGEQPDFTAAKNAVTTELRRAIGAPEIASPTRQTFDGWLVRAKQEGYDRKAERLAREVNETARSMTPIETAGAVVRMAQLKNEHGDLMSRVRTTTDAAETMNLSAEIERVESEIEIITRAVNSSGTEEARALVARKLMINQNYDLVSVLTRAKVAKKGELTTVERAKYEELTRKLQDMTDKVAKMQVELEINQATKILRKNATKRLAGMSIEQKNAQLNKLSERARALVDRPELSQVIHDMAMNLASRSDVRNLDDVVARMQVILPDIRRESVAQAIKETTSREAHDADELAKKLNEIKQEARTDVSLRKSIEQLEQHIESGTLPPPKGPGKTPPDAIKMAREVRDALKAKLSRTEPALKARVQRQIDVLNKRIASGNIMPKARVELPQPSKELRRMIYERDRKRQEIRIAIDAGRPKTWGFKIATNINAARAIMTGFDLSAALRQGATYTLGHPGKAIIATGKMLRAFASDQYASEVNAEIYERENAPLYSQSKLYLAPIDSATKLTEMEEAFMTHWTSKIPGIRASGRAYMTFLNLARADSFDLMADTLGKTRDITQEEGKEIARYVNAATGRGALPGGMENAAVAVNTLFFSPRYVASRFQLISGQPILMAHGRVRLQIIKEYARFLAGLGFVYIMGLLAGGKVERDPRSADFGKIRFGKTRIDPLAGISQTVVLLARVSTGRTKTELGGVEKIRGEDAKYGARDVAGVMGSFLRTKLAPIPATALDLLTGEDVVGQKVTLASEAFGLVKPMAIQDIYEAMKEHGVPKSAALGTLAIFGMGLQTYGPFKDKTDKDLIDLRKSAFYRTRGIREEDGRKIRYHPGQIKAGKETLIKAIDAELAMRREKGKESNR